MHYHRRCLFLYTLGGNLLDIVLLLPETSPVESLENPRMIVMIVFNNKNATVIDNGKCSTHVGCTFSTG